MSLGTNGFEVKIGDLVKVTTSRLLAVPNGTIAQISRIAFGAGRKARYQLTGYENAYVTADDLELVCYMRSIQDHWQ